MRFLAALGLMALLAGCGQTGPLYLPGEEPPQRESTTPVTAESTEAPESTE